MYNGYSPYYYGANQFARKATRNTEPEESKEIVVQGIGIVEVKSDMAVLIFELETENSDPIEAEKANQKMIDFAEDYMKKYGIRPEDYTYAREELVPIYDSSGNIKEYKASTIFRVKFYNINMISEFLYNIKGRHVLVNRIIFTLRDPKFHYQKALAEAVKGADNTVNNIANQINVTYDPVPYFIEETSDADAFYKQIYHSSEARDNPQTGFITITANVLAKYNVTGEKEGKNNQSSQDNNTKLPDYDTTIQDTIPVQPHNPI